MTCLGIYQNGHSKLVLKSPAIKSSWLQPFSVAIIGSNSVTNVVTFCSLFYHMEDNSYFPLKFPFLYPCP